MTKNMLAILAQAFEPVLPHGGGIAAHGEPTGLPAPPPADWREIFEERAAICEYDGGCSRLEAERLAREDIDRR